MKDRSVNIKRVTGETEVEIFFNPDGQSRQKNEIDTGIGFLDHMLTLFAAHGNFRLDIKCKGDLDVDFHHTAEDVGISLGRAFKESLGDKRGIKRYGFMILAMDEALNQTAVDFSGRAFLNFDVSFPTEKIGNFDSELIEEFFMALVRSSEITLHIRQLEGKNSHHIGESIFKSFGRACADAMAYDERRPDEIPSTKGII